MQWLRSAWQTNHPVRPEQGEQLLRIMIEATTRNVRGEIEHPMLIAWDQVDERAAAILSPAQWDLFRRAEAPGLGGGGARFVTRLNRALDEAAKAESAAMGKPD